MTTSLAKIAIAGAAALCFAGCASTRFAPDVMSEPPLGRTEDSACLDFVRASGVTGAGAPVTVVLMSAGTTRTSGDVICFLMPGVRVPAKKNGSLIDGSLGYRITFDAAKYRAVSDLVITIPHWLFGLARPGNRQRVWDEMLRLQTTQGNGATAGYGLGALAADEATRVEMVVTKEEFEHYCCSRILYGKTIGSLGSGGHLSYRVPAGGYVVQAWLDTYKFQGYVEWSKRAKSEPLPIPAKAGHTYTVNVTPDFWATPLPTINITCAERK